MRTVTKCDLKTLAAKLIEVFELEEFTRDQAIAVISATDFDSILDARLICTQPALFGDGVYTNCIPPTD